MKKYVEMDRFKERIQQQITQYFTSGTGGYMLAEDVIEDLAVFPTEDVVEVRHGTWLCEYDSDAGTTDVRCSICGDMRTINGCYVSINDEPLYNDDNYCPYCGAKMDGGK